MNIKPSKECNTNKSNGYINRINDALRPHYKITIESRIFGVLVGIGWVIFSLFFIFKYDYLIPLLPVRYQFSEGFLSHYEVMCFLFFRIIVGLFLFSFGFKSIAMGIMGQKSSVTNTKKKNKKFIRR